ncbi:MAG: hypothetical protein AVDCRST_MAG61-926, partial [uncultured Friedmanniella sp.]
ELRGDLQPRAPSPPRREGATEDARLETHPRRRRSARHRPRGRRREDHCPPPRSRAGADARRRVGSGHVRAGQGRHGRAQL